MIRRTGYSPAIYMINILLKANDTRPHKNSDGQHRSIEFSERIWPSKLGHLSSRWR